MALEMRRSRFHFGQVLPWLSRGAARGHHAEVFDDGARGGGGAAGDSANGGGAGAPGTRLRLLLSTGGWSPTPWADGLPMLLEPMGVSSVRVSSARQAERVIRREPVHIAVVDLTIPLDESDGESSLEDGGTRILELLSRLDQPPPTVVIKPVRSHRDDHRNLHAALRCGAFAVVDRASADLELMLGVMQRCLARFYAGRWPGGSGLGGGLGGGGTMYV